MDKESEGFGYFRQKLPKIIAAKMKERIFVGPQIKQQFEDQDLSTKLNSAGRRAWIAFKNVCRKFIGNEKRGNLQ